MKKAIRSILSLVLVLAMCLSGIVYAAPAEAEPTVYDGNAMEPFAGRTREEIGRHISEAQYYESSYRSQDPQSYYTQQPSLSAPYAAGTITDDTLRAMAAMTQYYRWLTGVQPMTEIAVNSDLQTAALIRNFQFDHFVDDSSMPEDMDPALWREGADVWHNILAWGYTPHGAIRGWMNEGYRTDLQAWDTVGHRTAIIDANISAIDYAFCDVIAIGVIAERRNTWGSNAFAAFPAPGFMPLKDVSAQESAWTVQLNPAVLRCPGSDAVRVIVTDQSTGERYECTEQNGKLMVSDVLAFVQPTVSEQYYADGSSYQVRITGLQNAADGSAAEIAYTVDFYDETNYTEAKVIEAIAEEWRDVAFPVDEPMPDPALFTALLPDEIRLTSRSGRIDHAPVAGAWQLDRVNQCWKNSVDPDALPDGFTDPDGVLDEVIIPYTFAVNSGAYLYSPDMQKPGDPGTICLIHYRSDLYNVGYGAVYQCVGSNDDSHLILRLDEHSDSCLGTDKSGSLNWEHTWAEEDSGVWVGIWHMPSGSVYVSGTEWTIRSCPHTDTYTEVLAPPTCTEEGHTVTICLECGETLETTTLPARGHLYWQGECIHCGQADPDYVPPDPCPSLDFRDVPGADNWAHEGIDFCLAYGLMNGTSGDLFSPNGTLTRAQLVTILYRTAGSPEIPFLGSFRDVEAGLWYSDAIEWAAANGIVNGKSEGIFDPSGKITREQIAAILYRYEGSPAAAGSLTFPDREEISPYARDAMLWAVQNGLISGIAHNGEIFASPASGATRAQIAAIMARFLQNLRGYSVPTWDHSV